MKVNELFEATRPRGWAMLPATKVIFDKAKATPDEVQSELGHGQKIIGLYMQRKEMSDTGKLIMVPGKNNKEGEGSAVFHDQTGRDMGRFTCVGHLKMGKNGWEVEASKLIPGLETPEQIAKFKAPVFVFK